MNYRMLVLLLIFCPAHGFFLSCVRKTQEHIPLYDDTHLDLPINQSQAILTTFNSGVPCVIVRTMPQTHLNAANWTLEVAEDPKNCIEVGSVLIMQSVKKSEPLKYTWEITRKKPGMAKLRATYTSPFSQAAVTQEFFVKVSA